VPYDQILSGLTFLPNLMAIGAPEDGTGRASERRGELSALGSNLPGTFLDVVDRQPLAQIDPGCLAAIHLGGKMGALGRWAA
jgi:hypothetical protein